MRRGGHTGGGGETQIHRGLADVEIHRGLTEGWRKAQPSRKDTHTGIDRCTCRGVAHLKIGSQDHLLSFRSNITSARFS